MKNTQEGDVVTLRGGGKGVVVNVWDGVVCVQDDDMSITVAYTYEIISNPMALQRIYEEFPI